MTDRSNTGARETFQSDVYESTNLSQKKERPGECKIGAHKVGKTILYSCVFVSRVLPVL